jgi:nicotinate-nucleotide adenylyltransferase
LNRTGLPPLGVLGGSFDPVHAGHLALARAAAQHLGLEQVLWVPAGQPWQKPGVLAARHRVAMLECALAGVPGWSVDRREVDRTGPSYTVDTLGALRAELGSGRPLVLIMGEDQFARLDSWHRWQALAELAHIAVAVRPGTAARLSPALQAYLAGRPDTPAALAQPAGAVVRVPMDPVDCASRSLRAQLAANPLARPAALPPAVLDYIAEHQLYR